MIAFNRKTRVFLCRKPTDMRSSYDSLFARVKDQLAQDPFSGHLFVFVNARRTMCKCLLYDGTGLVILSKRLEKGLFYAINRYVRGDIILTPNEFSLFFEGADLNRRFIDSPPEVRKKKLSRKSFRMQTLSYGNQRSSTTLKS